MSPNPSACDETTACGSVHHDNACLCSVLNMKRTSPIGLIVVVLLLVGGGPLTGSLFAATPVDLYQDMESGAIGDLLTAALMNASSHGKATWSVGHGELRVSTSKARELPGPVI